MGIAQRTRWNKYQRELNERLKDPKTTKADLTAMMVMPEYPKGVQGTITHEYTKSDE